MCIRDRDKTFPKSEKVDHEKVTFVNRYGITLAADLYKPQNASGKYPDVYKRQTCDRSRFQNLSMICQVEEEREVAAFG